MSWKLLLAGILLATPVLAQQSQSYKLQEAVFNNGGGPTGGVFASSASYRIKLDALGEAAIGSGLSSVTFRMDSGFTGAYPPPGEALGFRFISKTAMSWSPEKSVGSYSLYRGVLSTLPGTYGACFQSTLASAAANDATTPSSGSPYFYLATARNRLGEQGTKGYRSSGAERPNPAPCP